MTQKSYKRISYLVATMPATLIYASFIIFPALFSLIVSFTKWQAFRPMEFVGLKNFIDIFKNKEYLHGLRNNMLIVLVSVFGQIPIGFVLAYILNRKLIKWSSVFKSIIFLPITISPIVVAILWNHLFSSSGIIIKIIRIATKNPDYILQIVGDKQQAIIPILFVMLWMYTGTYMIIFLANLQKISPSVIEAAIIDGASEIVILIKIIIPQMIPVIFTTVIFAITGSLKSFDLIFAMTGGGPGYYTEVIAINMYKNTFKYGKYGYGSAISMTIIFFSIGLILLLRMVFKKAERKYL